MVEECPRKEALSGITSLLIQTILEKLCVELAASILVVEE